MMRKYILTLMLFFFLLTGHAEDKIELKMTTIRGNKELPQILYIVPWKNSKNTRLEEQNIVLHSLFGDLFDPMEPQELSPEGDTISAR